jgi:Uncharacterized conserved protein
MKKIFAILVSALAVCSFFSCAYKKPADTQRTITVSGTGNVSAEPDQASIIVSVVTQEWVAKLATDENAAAMTKVRDAVIAAGVKAVDITTTDYSVARQDTWANGRSWPGKFQVRNSLNIMIKNISSSGAVIDAAVAAGANELSSLSFSVADTAPLVRQARMLAVQQALDTASLLAGASGCKIGQVVSIQENGSAPSPVFDRMVKTEAAAAAADVPTPLTAGKVTVSAGVTVTYALQ